MRTGQQGRMPVIVRGILGMLSFLAIAHSAQGRVAISREDGVKKIHVTVDGFEKRSVQVDGKNFTSLQLSGVDGHQGVDFKVGSPAVPVVRFLVTGNPKVEWNQDAMQTRSLEKPIMPSQHSREKKHGKVPAFAFDRSEYARNEFLQKVRSSIEPAGSVRGEKQWMITIYPVRYNPAQNTIETVSDFTITTSAAKQNIDMRKDGIAFVVGQKFQDSASLANYAEFKRSIGFDVRMINISDSVRTADDVRRELKALLVSADFNLRHAVMIGDAEDVPSHDSSIISGFTDHYYRAIDTDNYLADINGPDIGVGRVSATTEQELSTILAKFTRYYDGNFASETWLNEVAFIATDDRYQVAEGSHNYAINNYTKPNGYLGHFPAATQEGGDQLYAITHSVTDAKVVETMKAGRTIINYSGHGGTTSWAGPRVSQADVRSLTDRDALPFVISNACITGDFRVAESFGETWQRHDAGAIMFWGSMDSSYWDEDDILEKAMYDTIYRDNKFDFNTITNASLAAVWNFYGGQNRAKYYWETYVTFGDPSMMLRTTETRQLDIVGPSAIPVGTSQVELQIVDQGTPVANAVVSISMGTIVASGKTDSRGMVTLNTAEALQPMTANVAIVAPNARMAAHELNIIAANNPFITSESFTVNTRPENGIYAGERSHVQLAIANVGMQGTSGGSLQVAEVSGPISISNGQVNIPAMAAQTHGVSVNGLGFVVNSNAQAFETARVKINWSLAEGFTGSFSLNLVVKRGQISVAGMDFGGEEGIAPGSSGPVFLTVTNSGNESIRNATLTARPTNACLSDVSGEIVVQNLAVGETARLSSPFTVSVDASCVNGSQGTLAVIGSYDGLATTTSLTAESSLVVGITSVNSSNNTAVVQIPDAGAFVSSDLTIDRNVVITDIGVAVKITHPYIGDLLVRVVAPSGKSVTLHERAGGSNDNIEKTFGLGGEETAALSELIGEAGRGQWKLEVQDTASTDVGSIENFGLTIKGYWAN
jgi:subtilisin-like proprotein convertase family protein